MATMDELFADFERERLAEIARWEARQATPEARAFAEKHRQEENNRIIRTRRKAIRTERSIELSAWGVA